MAKKNEIEDPFDFDEEDEEQAAEPTPEPPNPELEELREFKQVALAAQREGEISDCSRRRATPASSAKLWSALNPEGLPTAESLKAFASEYDLAPTRPVGYTPTMIGNEATSMPTAKTYTRAEMEEIAKVNPARAQALAEQGRIVWNNPEIEGRPRR